MLRRNFPNRHKLKKKLKRKSNQLRNSLFNSDSTTARHDFSWKGRNYNPHISNRGEKDQKPKIKLIILMVSILSSFLILVLHPFFYIKKININGLQRISKSEVVGSIEGIISHKKLLVLPRSNYFFTDLDEIRDILKTKFPINSIVVSKSFPNKIEVIIEEKISTIIFDNGKQYVYLDLKGNVVEILKNVSEYEWLETTETVTSTNSYGELIVETKIIERKHLPDTKNIILELGDYPIVFDQDVGKLEINSNVVDKSYILAIVDWFNYFNQLNDNWIKYFEITNSIGDTLIHTNSGLVIKCRLSGDHSKQIAELKAVLENKKQINYIDLRYPDRIYMQ